MVQSDGKTPVLPTAQDPMIDFKVLDSAYAILMDSVSVELAVILGICVQLMH